MGAKSQPSSAQPELSTEATESQLQITPRKFSRQQPTFGSLHSNIIAKLALEMTHGFSTTTPRELAQFYDPFCLLKTTMNEGATEVCPK